MAPREIAYDAVVEAVRDLCIAAAYELNDEMTVAFERARDEETHPPAAQLLGQLLDNARIARQQRLPLCQDTGFAVVFIEQGNRCWLAPPADRDTATLEDAVNEGVAQGYAQGLLRSSIAAEPLDVRGNTGTNTPAVVHHRWVPGKSLRLTVMAKGGGCENKSVFKMFRPTAEAAAIVDFVVETARQTGADACPPFVIGVGLGGTFEKCCLLAKQALLRPLDSAHPNAYYAALEAEMLTRVNDLDVGPAGLGGRATALAVLVETFPCHIASLPVAINIECHSHRHKSLML